MDAFCKEFLDDKTYKSLQDDGIFIAKPYNKGDETEEIEAYLKHSVLIYSAILGTTHSFVQDYVVQNTIK